MWFGRLYGSFPIQLRWSYVRFKTTINWLRPYDFVNVICGWINPTLSNFNRKGLLPWVDQKFHGCWEKYYRMTWLYNFTMKIEQIFEHKKCSCIRLYQNEHQKGYTQQPNSMSSLCTLFFFHIFLPTYRRLYQFHWEYDRTRGCKMNTNKRFFFIGIEHHIIIRKLLHRGLNHHRTDDIQN